MKKTLFALFALFAATATFADIVALRPGLNQAPAVRGKIAAAEAVTVEASATVALKSVCTVTAYTNAYRDVTLSHTVYSFTVTNWNKYVADKKDPDFGRSTGMEADLSEAPYYAIKIAPGIHHTMGGVKIDTEAEVISTENKPIPGLFAAGEVTGGVHGGNRIGGTAVTDIVVFGTIASESAVEYCDK